MIQIISLSLFLSGSVFNGGKYSNENMTTCSSVYGKESSNPDKKWGNDLAAEKISVGRCGNYSAFISNATMLVKSSVA